MTKNLSGLVADQRTALHGVLRNWIKTNLHVADTWEGIDAPWWYNERASLSVLAGAIWRCGGIAFEEFSEVKFHAKRREGPRESYRGRCDIHFQVGSKDFVAEAKYGYSGATARNADVVPKIAHLLDDARKATGRLAPNGQCRLAMVFIAPYFTQKFKGDEEAMMNRWIKKIREVPCSAKAWVFPATARGLQPMGGGYYHPGAAIFIQNVQRSIRG